MILTQAKINGLDIYSFYGVGITSGLKALSRPADMKTAEEQDWPERNGKEYSLTDKVQDFDSTLDCFIQGDNKIILDQRKTAFEAMLRSAMIVNLTVIDTNITYNVKYNKISDYTIQFDSRGNPVATFKLDLTVLQGDQPVLTRILDGNG